MFRRALAISAMAVLLVALMPLAAFAAGEQDIEWCFTFDDGWSECGTSTTMEAEIHGMTIHVSCSDVFEDGYSSTGGEPSEEAGDPAIVQYHIERYRTDKKTGERILQKECGETFSTPPEEPEDVCPNLEGTQETMPEGYELDEDGNCVLPENEEPSGTPTSGTPTSEPPLEVLGEEFTREVGVLPATGAPAGLMLLAALASFLAGGTMLRIGRRKSTNA